MFDRIDRLFEIRARGSTVGRELIAGITTFLTMCYVLFAHPAILEVAGMPRQSVFVATCVASALGCFLMGYFANYPVALAPAMGHNVFFAITVCGVLGFTWQQALTANLLAGLFFLCMSRVGLREHVMASVPPPLRYAIAAGIGLLIAFLGLQWGHIVQDDPAVLVKRASLANPIAWSTLAGLLVSSSLLVLRVPGALLGGIMASMFVLWHFGLLDLSGLARPFSVDIPADTILRFDFAGLFGEVETIGRGIAVIVVFLLLDMFDTVGTLLGLTHAAGLLRGDHLPRAREALTADAAATVVGCCLGTSTVTSYVESSAGIAVGGRTGLVAWVVGALFLISLCFAPVAALVGAPVAYAGGNYYPTIAPILVLVGAFMATGLQEVRWTEPSEGIPAFVTLLVMMCTFSITDGIGWGYLTYCVLKLVRREPQPASLYVVAALFASYFVTVEYLS